MEGVAGAGLDVGRSGGCVPHTAQDLRIERWAHLVNDLAASCVPKYSSLLNLILHQDLQSHRLCLNPQDIYTW